MSREICKICLLAITISCSGQRVSFLRSFDSQGLVDLQTKIKTRRGDTFRSKKVTFSKNVKLLSMYTKFNELGFAVPLLADTFQQVSYQVEFLSIRHFAPKT